ncbi:MAG: hypothetical protein VW257_08720 [Quisquiliibacterium sp.]
MKRKSRILGSMLVTTAALAAAGAAQAQDKALKIYGFGAKSGVVGIFGQQSEAAMQAAANIINKAGGVTLGDGSKARLVIEYLDDRCNAEEGINALRKSVWQDSRQPGRLGHSVPDLYRRRRQGWSGLNLAVVIS